VYAATGEFIAIAKSPSRLASIAKGGRRRSVAGRL
jgi:hypothetical protein